MTFLVAILTQLRRLPPWVWVAFLLLGTGWWYGRVQFNAGQADIQAKWDESRAKADKAERAKEQAWNKAVWDLAYAAEIKRAEREQETDRTIADLRDGTLRLRDRFTCPKASRDPAAAAPAQEPGLLNEDVEFLLRFAGEADTIADERNQCIASYNALRASP